MIHAYEAIPDLSDKVRSLLEANTPNIWLYEAIADALANDDPGFLLSQCKKHLTDLLPLASDEDEA